MKPHENRPGPFPVIVRPSDFRKKCPRRQEAAHSGGGPGSGADGSRGTGMATGAYGMKHREKIVAGN